jgi:hypothetical protein
MGHVHVDAFAPKSEFGVGDDPESLALGDLNGDSILAIRMG